MMAEKFGWDLGVTSRAAKARVAAKAMFREIVDPNYEPWEEVSDASNLSDSEDTEVVPVVCRHHCSENKEEDIDGDMVDMENLNYDDLDSVSKLQKTQRYIDIMKKVEDALVKGSDMLDNGMVLEDDPEYQLIVDCNALSVDIENEIVIIHNFIRVTVSTTIGKPLLEEGLQKTIDACDRALALDSSKKKVLDFVESRMGYIAPNLSAIVGSAVAAKLMGTAGGLSELAKMPAGRVQFLGAKKKNFAAFSTARSQFRLGYIGQAEILQSTPPSLRLRGCRVLAARLTLAARVDSFREDPTGKRGIAFRDQIHKKFEKWHEERPAKQPKPLPVPDSEPKKKRGGRQLRKMKERYAITDMTKMANKMQFGVPEESSLGICKLFACLRRLLLLLLFPFKIAAKVAKKFEGKNYGSSDATTGLTSSLASTPVQGIELSNPQAHANQLGSGTEVGTFSKIKRT